MNFGKWIKEAWEMFGGAINLALIPVRLPGALCHFVAEEWTRWEQERVAKALFSPLSEQSDDESPFSNNTRDNWEERDDRQGRFDPVRGRLARAR